MEWTRIRAVMTAVAVTAGVVLFDAFYVVSEIERAVVIELGRLQRHSVEPGLHFKVPIIQTVRKFDKRIHTLDDRNIRDYLTAEKKSLRVDSYVNWRIKSETQFLEATGGNTQNAERLLWQRVDTGLRDQFGKRIVKEVISGEREEIMVELRQEIGGIAERELGIEIVDIRIKRIELPPAASESVYQRMRAERQRLAGELRAEGAEQAEIIRSEADKDRRVILAEAYRIAELTRGQGDAEAASIYGKAYSDDEELFSLLRTLRAYSSSLRGERDTLVLDADSEFFSPMKGQDTQQSQE